MSNNQENIFGNRLKLARKMAGKSLQELADSLENKITKQALSKYEMGLMNPSNEVLMALSKTLRVKPEYFLKRNQIELGEICFRKRTTLSQKNEDSIIEKARDYVERFCEIENILAIDNLFINPIRDIYVSNKNDAEIAANALRIKWELGINPISNIIEMLELKGIKIMLIDEADEIDGFASYTLNGIPIIVVNTRNKSIERLRFTIIHELGHLLLNFADAIKEANKQIEELCHHFSSCFLIPSQMLLKMMGNGKRTYIAIKELISIKEYYGISIRAIVHRLKSLEIITPTYYQKWIIYMSKTYGQKEEPGRYVGEEKSKIFEMYINRALSEGLISLSKAASIFNINTNDLRKNFIGVE
ncbi:MAG: ImmA/IrrE family metallo-endopeptidase [Chitinophagales bacterium]|nr:ImmA/IrrE family metallo-endopeptidase [Chitinophagales bacterium]